MHIVAVLALDQVVPFDLATPIEVFSRTRLPGGRVAYEVRICGTGDLDAGTFLLRPPWDLAGLADADTVIVPGRASNPPLPPPVAAALRDAAARGTRIAAICPGPSGP